MGAPGQVTFGSASCLLLTPEPQFLPIIWEGRVGMERGVARLLTWRSPQAVVGPPGAKGEKVSREEF